MLSGLLTEIKVLPVAYFKPSNRPSNLPLLEILIDVQTVLDAGTPNSIRRSDRGLILPKASHYP